MTDLLKDFASDLLETADPEVAKARVDICAFAEFVMRDPSGAPFKLKSFHKTMLKAMVSHRWLLIEAFRGSGKSTLTSILYPLWLIMQNRDVRIMLVTASDVLSKQWLREIESYMMSPQYQRLVGDIIPSRAQVASDNLKWGEGEKAVLGRSPEARGLTLLALGTQGQIRGRRVDVAICDDIMSESNSFTPYQRDVLDHWFHTALLPTLDFNPADPLSGQCIFIGTPLYDADLLGQLKSEWKDMTCTNKSCPVCN